MIRETVTASLNFFVCGFNFWSFKWRFSNQLCINNNSDWPNINFIRVTFSLKNFRRNIIWSTANCFLFFLIVLQSGGKTKVTKFDFHVFIEEEITQLEISVNDFINMKVFKRTNNLNQVILNFHLSQSFSSFDKFIQSVICTNFEQNVHIFMIFKNMLKFDNVVVIQWFMNLNLSNKFLFGTRTI